MFIVKQFRKTKVDKLALFFQHKEKLCSYDNNKNPLQLSEFFDGDTTKSVYPSFASADERKIIGALSMIL